LIVEAQDVVLADAVAGRPATLISSASALTRLQSNAAGTTVRLAAPLRPAPLSLALRSSAYCAPLVVPPASAL
jgi:hypothetical protein